ncbi:DUF21 domain-containing protein [Smittium culicis]|uniref:DUF21 domain-containing protein n=1 Tax=Smittium culicis TaxID=133412 RepID=A0A1R1X2Z9_9FUNG|nr:DUF21 domain-containing protein [Smittium culicis]OMJ11347.1 DUF21 domain-containing protein [Smittium culicis]
MFWAGYFWRDSCRPLKALQFFLYPISFPISLILDHVLGSDKRIVYQKSQLKELVSLSETVNGGLLSHDEVTIIQGALDLSEKLVVDVMTDLKNVYMISYDEELDSAKLIEIVERGYSRVPVYANNNRNNIIGVLLVKSLVLINPEKKTLVRDLPLRHIPCITSEISLYEILNAFQEGGCHMAVVAAKPPYQKDKLQEGMQSNHSRSNSYSNQGMAQQEKNSVTHLDHVSLLNNGESSKKNEATPLIQENTKKPKIYNEEDFVDNSLTPIGIITLEDVIEELIQEEIIDETDVFIDIRNNLKVSRVLNTSKLSSNNPNFSRSAGRKKINRNSCSEVINDSSQTFEHLSPIYGGNVSKYSHKYSGNKGKYSTPRTQTFLGTKTFSSPKNLDYLSKSTNNRSDIESIIEGQSMLPPIRKSFS